MIPQLSQIVKRYVKVSPIIHISKKCYNIGVQFVFTEKVRL